VTFVATEDFMESIPCFNVTKEESRISTDADVNVTLTSSGSENLTLDSLSASEVASYVADATDVDNGKTAAYLRAAMQELW
jgi:acyl carrier protein